MNECCGAYCEEVCDCGKGEIQQEGAEPVEQEEIYATCFYLGDGTRIVKKP